MKSMSRSEVGLHNPRLFAMGDRVVVSLKVESQDGCSSPWVASMDQAIGKVYTVEAVDKQMGYQLKVDGFYFFFPSAALSLAMFSPEKNRILIGDEVMVEKKLAEYPGWNNDWVSGMDKYVGVVGTVGNIGTGGVYITNGGEFRYPIGSLRVVSKIVSQGDMMDTKPIESGKSYAGGIIEEGDFVAVVKPAKGWAGNVPTLDKYVGDGQSYKVIKVYNDTGTYGTYYRLSMGYDFPGFSLMVLRKKDGTVVKPAKKKRVRVGPGPWDAAPCPHLRWILIGFFRGNLALRKSKVQVDGKEVELGTAEVVCKKCNKSMTLNAK